jgi:hypothetical protein
VSGWLPYQAGIAAGRDSRERPSARFDHGSRSQIQPARKATRAARIRRDGYDLDGTLISKEIVHAVTSLGADLASAADLARIARGQWGIESVHWLRDTAYAEDASTGYAGNGPQVMATLRNLAISLLYLAGVTEITRTLQAVGRDRTRILDYLPL